MRNPLITVVAVNYNQSILFVELMLYALDKLTFNDFEVIICDNGSNKKNIRLLKNYCEIYDNVKLIERQQSKSGSYGHAEALDFMIAMVDTNFTLVTEPDCALLIKNWDKILLKELDQETKIIGTTTPKDRTRDGIGNFPLPFATLLETKAYRDLAISCMPREIEKGEDTCWQWKTAFLDHGYLGKTFVTKNTRNYKDGPFNKLTGIEEYYTDNGELIASHFGRGSEGGLAKYISRENQGLRIFLQTTIPQINRLLTRRTAQMEMRLWTEKCYQIIDRQQ